MKLSPKYLVAVPVIALLLSAAVACSDDSDDTNDNTPATSAPAGAVTTQAALPAPTQ